MEGVLLFVLIIVIVLFGIFLDQTRRKGRENRWNAGRRITTRRGECVRSQGERRVANYLLSRGYDYQYEPKICGFRPDFYIPSLQVIVEYWGMSHAAYVKRRKQKCAAYHRAGQKYINLESADWPRLERELGRKLYYFEKRAGIK